MRVFVVLVLLVLFSSVALAVPDLKIQKVEKSPVVIRELNNPAVYDFMITNNGPEENFEIYSLAGLSMAPRGFFKLPTGETTLEVFAYPNQDLRQRTGSLSVGYEIQGQDSGILQDTIPIRIVSLSEVIEIEASEIYPADWIAILTVKNRENTQIDNLNINFDSAFFEGEKTISLEPFGTANVSFPIKPDPKLNSGPYIVKAEVELGDAKEEFEAIISYAEREGVLTSTNSEGLVVRKTMTTKINDGNIPVGVSIEIERGFIGRLFTVNSVSPTTVERDRFSVKYTWFREIAPAESFTVTTTTNYTIPFVIVVLIILIVIGLRIYSSRDLSLSKKVSFVKTKGGELALKVTIRAKAKRHLDKVIISDTLPRMTKLYEKFGRKPDKIDKEHRRVSWEFERLNSGEERTISYIIYSKVAVVGRFELPATTAVYKKDGETQHVESNRAYFVADSS